MIIRSTHRIYFALGCNIDQELKMQSAQRYLKSLFRDVRFSSAVWTEPVIIDGEPFLNCMGTATTSHERIQIERALKQIQHKCGDSKGKRRIKMIAMDIDLLQYDDERFHLDDWNREYIQQLYKELQPAEHKQL